MNPILTWLKSLITRIKRFSAPKPCPICGGQRRTHWTLYMWPRPLIGRIPKTIQGDPDTFAERLGLIADRMETTIALGVRAIPFGPVYTGPGSHFLPLLLYKWDSTTQAWLFVRSLLQPADLRCPSLVEGFSLRLISELKEHQSIMPK